MFGAHSELAQLCGISRHEGNGQASPMLERLNAPPTPGQRFDIQRSAAGGMLQLLKPVSQLGDIVAGHGEQRFAARSQRLQAGAAVRFPFGAFVRFQNNVPAIAVHTARAYRGTARPVRAVTQPRLRPARRTQMFAQLLWHRLPAQRRQHLLV